MPEYKEDKMTWADLVLQSCAPAPCCSPLHPGVPGPSTHRITGPWDISKLTQVVQSHHPSHSPRTTHLSALQFLLPKTFLWSLSRSLGFKPHLHPYTAKWPLTNFFISPCLQFSSVKQKRQWAQPHVFDLRIEWWSLLCCVVLLLYCYFFMTLFLYSTLSYRASPTCPSPAEPSWLPLVNIPTANTMCALLSQPFWHHAETHLHITLSPGSPSPQIQRPYLFYLSSPVSGNQHTLNKRIGRWTSELLMGGQTCGAAWGNSQCLFL